jgi:hypothetical protein
MSNALPLGSTYYAMTTVNNVDPSQFPNVVRARLDPSGLTCVVTNPAGATSTYTYPASIYRASQGVYYARVLLSVAGKWSFAWTTSGVDVGVCPLWTVQAA